MTGVPSPRIWHVDVWTGQELIVWGGCTGSTSCPNEVYTGGRYNPISDSWMSTSIQSAPSERSNSTAIWTGEDMLVWAGMAGNVGTYTTTGGLYHVSYIPNTPPQALPDSFITDEDLPLIVPAPGILENDTDEDDNPLTALLVSNPIHGTLDFASDGAFTYTPDLDFNGSDNFTYRATDGMVVSNMTTVTITVTSINDAPLAMEDAYMSDQDTDLVIQAPGVLANDSDIDDDSLTVILVAPPVHGSLLLNVEGSFIYTPEVGYSGIDQFTYQASDGDALSEVTAVNITIVASPPPGTGQRFYLPIVGR